MKVLARHDKEHNLLSNEKELKHLSRVLPDLTCVLEIILVVLKMNGKGVNWKQFSQKEEGNWNQNLGDWIKFGEKKPVCVCVEYLKNRYNQI